MNCAPSGNLFDEVTAARPGARARPKTPMINAMDRRVFIRHCPARKSLGSSQGRGLEMAATDAQRTSEITQLHVGQFNGQPIRRLVKFQFSMVAEQFAFLSLVLP